MYSLYITPKWPFLDYKVLKLSVQTYLKSVFEVFWRTHASIIVTVLTAPTCTLYWAAALVKVTDCFIYKFPWTGRVGAVVTLLDMYSRGLRFEYWPGHRLS
jgi:hypothetical protein